MRIDQSFFLTKSTSAPKGDELGLINHLLRSLCCFLDSSCISDGAKQYGALSTGVAPGTRSIRYLTILVGGSPDKSFGKTSLSEVDQEMAHLSAATSALSASSLFNRRVVHWGKMFKCSPSNKFRSSSSFFATSSSTSGQLSIVNSANVGNAEVAQEEVVKPSYSWPDNKRPRVCILGGGFGGLYTALRLDSLTWPDDKKPQVILVDQSERFVFKPMLYELLTGEVDAWEIAPRFSDLLVNTGVQFMKDRVKVLSPCDHVGSNGGPTVSGCGGTVQLESGLVIEYDWLVLSLGAEPKLDIIPGAVEFALPFSTLDDALKVNDKLTQLERENFGKADPIRVVVVGLGYSGVELAATVSERLEGKGVVQAISVDSSILPTAPPGNKEAALKVLNSRNVQLLLGYYVRRIGKAGDFASTLEQSDIAATVKDPEQLIVEVQPTEKGAKTQLLEADLVLWTVGNKPLLPVLEPNGWPFELPVTGRGQAETDETLQVKGHPRIFAVGDSSALRDPKGKVLPATAQVAFQQADFAGWNIWAAINNRPLLPFRFQNLGEMMVLGRYDAAITPSFIEGLTLEGPIGHAARKLAYLIRLPTDEHRVKVGLSWLAKSAVESVATVQSNITKVLSDS
ncbi:alternative NAD(P)H-ubiquinone oxidoreductase C1, chloroplastic/mitochondrial [Tanacetum coccineum]